MGFSGKGKGKRLMKGEGGGGRERGVRRRPRTAATIEHLVLLKPGKLDGLWEGERP